MIRIYDWLDHVFGAHYWEVEYSWGRQEVRGNWFAACFDQAGRRPWRIFTDPRRRPRRVRRLVQVGGCRRYYYELPAIRRSLGRKVEWTDAK